MFAYLKMKRICWEYAQQNLQDAEDWFARYDVGEPHAFSREFQIKLNTAIYGEAFTDAEINDYLHPACRPDPKTDGRKIRFKRLGMRYAAAIITAAVLTTSALVGLGGVIADPQSCNDVQFSSVKSGCFDNMVAGFLYPSEYYNSSKFNGHVMEGHPDHVSPFQFTSVPEGFELKSMHAYSTDSAKGEIELNGNWDQVNRIDYTFTNETMGRLHITVQTAHTSRFYFNERPKPEEGISRVINYRGQDAFLLTEQKLRSKNCALIWCDGLNDYKVFYNDHFSDVQMNDQDIQNFVFSVANSIQLLQK